MPRGYRYIKENAKEILELRSAPASVQESLKTGFSCRQTEPEVGDGYIIYSYQTGCTVSFNHPGSVC